MDRELRREIDKEQVKPRDHDREDQQDLKQARPVVREEDREQAGGVAAAMRRVLGEVPELEISEGIDLETARALELLFNAKTGEEHDLGAGHISAVERMKALNVALTVLHSKLAVGMTSELTAAREKYVEIADRVQELRQEIGGKIAQEAVKPLRPAKDKKKDEDEDDDDDKDDDDKDGDDDGESSDDKDGILKRLFRSKKKEAHE